MCAVSILWAQTADSEEEARSLTRKRLEKAALTYWERTQRMAGTGSGKAFVNHLGLYAGLLGRSDPVLAARLPVGLPP